VLTLSVIGVLLLAIVASSLPALRAASINPMQALRGE
jgi:ABC-type lipoprotein release transport system permease subunit